MRKKGEMLQDYTARHRKLLIRMKEVKMELPDAPAGHHVLTRAAIPLWQESTVRSQCGPS